MVAISELDQELGPNVASLHHFSAPCDTRAPLLQRLMRVSMADFEAFPPISGWSPSAGDILIRRVHTTKSVQTKQRKRRLDTENFPLPAWKDACASSSGDFPHVVPEGGRITAGQLIDENAMACIHLHTSTP
ncbi:hypothetical protein GJ744_005282 [Endocarpon pusillum]|uniref:Uncharacterized protein n=1 Tax=Endocarpon pusillum TaxID=364733 RepID=A0A8H7A812_9EURO|nr:hypothetical protein GJ744_005282 [Endocarpon pusillum]